MSAMSKPKLGEQGGLRRSGPYHTYYGPVLWIVILLAGWLLITEWQELPELISSTMAALP
jgi:hypothetical protein